MQLLAWTTRLDRNLACLKCIDDNTVNAWKASWASRLKQIAVVLKIGWLSKFTVVRCEHHHENGDESYMSPPKQAETRFRAR